MPAQIPISAALFDDTPFVLLRRVVYATVDVTFENVLKKFTVEVVKKDIENGTAQGNASLAGAVYGIYNGDELIDTYTTDEYGSFTTHEFECGENWTIKELTPSEGYLLDSTVYAEGDVSGAIQSTWNDAKSQIKSIVNNVVFPVLDVVLVILLFVKIGTLYMEYRKHGQFEWSATRS